LGGVSAIAWEEDQKKKVEFAVREETWKRGAREKKEELRLWRQNSAQTESLKTKGEEKGRKGGGTND